LGFELPEDNATTLAGFLMYESRTVPNVGQRFVFFGYSFEIIRRKNNQITLIRAEALTK
jgi:Mg2+/Co2+ transporter CorB